MTRRRLETRAAAAGEVPNRCQEGQRGTRCAVRSPPDELLPLELLDPAEELAPLDEAPDEEPAEDDAPVDRLPPYVVVGSERPSV